LIFTENQSFSKLSPIGFVINNKNRTVFNDFVIYGVRGKN
jgi:hypothetical protein